MFFINYLKKKNITWPIFSSLFIITLFTVVIISRLYFLQVVHGEKYRAMVFSSQNKYSQDKVFDRGKIYFKNNQELIPVALQRTSYILVINNKDNIFIKFNNENEVYKKIASIIKLDKEKFLKLARKQHKAYIEITNNLSEDEAKKIRQLDIKGLSLKEESKRYYPMEEVTSEIVGFVNSRREGISGLEKHYDSLLQRKDEKNNDDLIVDLFFKPFSDLFEKKEIHREANLITSVDLNIQAFLDDLVKEVNNKFSSKKTLAIIIKPGSGEIVAMVNTNKKKALGSFDITQSRYEPGSIIKPLVVALALDSGSITKDFSYFDKGCVFVKNDKVCNYDKRARGAHTNLTKIIAQSLNVGMVEIEKKIEKNIFLEYFIKFGLSEETGVDLPNEISQNISSLNYKIPINYATAAFGQGISASPLGILRSLSIIANDGFLIEPHIVTEIEYNNQNIPNDVIEKNSQRVLKKDTVNKIQKIMIDAVNLTPSKLKYKPKYYSVAAKTGTAQVAGKDGGYKENANIHTFFGYFPAKAKVEDRYAIILFTFEPKAKYSSQTLTKPFFDIMKFLIHYYDIKPDMIK